MTGVSGHVTAMSGHVNSMSGHVTGVSGYMTGVSGHVTSMSDHVTKMFWTCEIICVHVCSIGPIIVMYFKQPVENGSLDEESCDHSYEYVTLLHKLSEVLVSCMYVCVNVCICMPVLIWVWMKESYEWWCDGVHMC